MYSKFYYIVCTEGTWRKPLQSNNIQRFLVFYKYNNDRHLESLAWYEFTWKYLPQVRKHSVNEISTDLNFRHGYFNHTFLESFSTFPTAFFVYLDRTEEIKVKDRSISSKDVFTIIVSCRFFYIPHWINNRD